MIAGYITIFQFLLYYDEQYREMNFRWKLYSIICFFFFGQVEKKREEKLTMYFRGILIRLCNYDLNFGFKVIGSFREIKFVFLDQEGFVGVKIFWGREDSK